ncbi:hypothetical protein [cf. Phormidesmis sp. LEGE 11477]|uniref:hypothetical protein n=1 Tax=cf. Phormidesmis sp. LEGE 11477 TaxID=1828680 RepID=UPI001883080A|nr:hypothetical protein [cf. Phormidesmis sp. LEGE 11477]MBE9062095.1 hypothetical protein [cf. Phormidesmis sp. LEGE 11477]
MRRASDEGFDQVNSVLLRPQQITRLLFVVVAVLTGLSLIESLVGRTSILKMGSESSLPTWYAASILLLSAILLSLIARAKQRQHDTYAKHWTVLSLIFYVLSIDEIAKIHERMGAVVGQNIAQWLVSDLESLAPTQREVFNYAWVIVAIPLLILFFLAYLRFVTRLPPQVRTLFIMAAIIFLSGAVGLETLSGYQHYLNGDQTWTYTLLTTLEEALEKIGTVVFIHALLLYISTYLDGMQIVLEGKSSVAKKRSRAISR